MPDELRDSGHAGKRPPGSRVKADRLRVRQQDRNPEYGSCDAIRDAEITSKRERGLRFTRQQEVARHCDPAGDGERVAQ